MTFSNLYCGVVFNENVSRRVTSKRIREEANKADGLNVQPEAANFPCRSKSMERFGAVEVMREVGRYRAALRKMVPIKRKY